MPPETRRLISTMLSINHRKFLGGLQSLDRGGGGANISHTGIV